jgi:hypothetical protein
MVSMGVDLPTLRAKLFRLLMGTNDSVVAGSTKRQDQVEEIRSDQLDSTGEFEVAVVVPDNFL